MDLDPMINTSQDENDYIDYDNRPIRPMDQDALNEALARLPILIDEDELANSSDPNTSIKSRRQPVLAYSTRRKNFSGVNINQSILNTTDTPMNNKRKLGGCTPINKFIKQLDSRQDLIQLKEENKTLEEAKMAMELEGTQLRKSYETEFEILKQEHQQIIDALIEEHNLQCERLNASLADKEQLLMQTNLELDNLRNDHTMLLLEKETLDKIVEEYQLVKEEMNQKLTENEIMIKNLRNELENLTKTQQEKQSVSKFAPVNGRIPPKEASTDRSRTPNTIGSINRSNAKVCPSLNKPTPSALKFSLSKSKPIVFIDDKKKSLSTDKHANLTGSARLKPKILPTK